MASFLIKIKRKFRSTLNRLSTRFEAMTRDANNRSWENFFFTKVDKLINHLRAMRCDTRRDLVLTSLWTLGEGRFMK